MLKILNLCRKFEFGKFLNWKFKKFALLSYSKKFFSWNLYPALRKRNIKLLQSSIDKWKVCVGNSSLMLKIWHEKFGGAILPYSDGKINTEAQQMYQLTWTLHKELVFHSKLTYFHPKLIANFFSIFLKGRTYFCNSPV